MDCTTSESGTVLSTPDVKVKVSERYDAIDHPTINSMATEWCEYADGLGVPLREYRLFKVDFSWAFTQMDMNPESALLLALAMGDG